MDGQFLLGTGLSRAFGGINAVAGVDITIAPRDLLCVIGPNGAGKSTLAVLVETDVAPLADYYGDGRMHSIQWSVFFAQRVRHMEEADWPLLDPDLKALAETGAQVDAATLVDALSARHALTTSMETFFQHHDLLVTPTFHCRPPPVAGLAPHLRQAPVLTAWCNQAGLPAISVPCGFAGDLPVGMQIVGPRGSDALVLRAARAYELARGDFPAPAGELQLPGDMEIAP
ncbi:amidase family protein [Burkholderia multivorans]|uniref:amidase family protein n=1 Tax=Burkholderia multivorans TaxID=87883 RepID=UPI0020B2BA71|nr:amidase family protein [Burkholderia multivorans]MDN8000211.1 amidase family protein [Burkholderia multivorans]